MPSGAHLHRSRQEEADPAERVHVLVQFKTDVSALREMGCEVTSRAGDVAAVFVRAGELGKLHEHPGIVFVETDRALKDETDVSTVAINLADPATGSRVIEGDGRGALIGVIDSGFDLTHPAFLDPRGKTRIVAAWDQMNLAASPDTPPPAFGYGVEYTGTDIDEHVSARKVLVVKNREGAGAHGTHVAGIAAGNGEPRCRYKGVAPEAGLVLVTYRNDVPVGGSAYALDAMEYVRRRAAAVSRPVVINLSQGDNLGAHDGKSLLERAIDHIVDEGRVLVVVSAGNERGGPACHHARGRVEQGRELSLSFALSLDGGRRVGGDVIDLWYHGGDRFAVALQTPGGERSAFVEPGGTGVVVGFQGGSRARVYSQTGHPSNGDNRVSITFEAGEGWEAGVWQLILRGDRVGRGDFDAWADRPDAVTVIDFRSHRSDASTITLPGNSRRAITVGGFISRRHEGASEVEGDFAPGSSAGPTRDGRIKPDLAAPSTLVMAPGMRADAGETPRHDFRSGTSMAAPHVTGVVALLWALWPGLAAAQVRDALLSGARNDAFTGPTPNTNWGHGKLDAGAAYRILSILAEKGERAMTKTQVVEFETNPRADRYDELAGVKIRFGADGDAALLITTAPTGDPAANIHTETLTLTELGVSSLLNEKAGGDECWVNGVWVTPCPIGTGMEHSGVEGGEGIEDDDEGEGDEGDPEAEEETEEETDGAGT
ncbi:MAG TPA: S8 family peptidase [Pyrinomonadaceae bacterium]|nr:S8 family peptidase [Pyrinomonadaceae bacterium]